MTSELPRPESFVPDATSTSAAATRRLTWGPWRPALTIVGAVVSWVPIGFLVDASSLRREEGMWFGYAFFGLFIAFYALVPLSLTVVTGIGGTLSRSSRSRWRWEAGGTLIVLLFSLPALFIGTVESLDRPYQADLAFFLPCTAITLIGATFVARSTMASRPRKR